MIPDDIRAIFTKRPHERLKFQVVKVLEPDDTAQYCVVLKRPQEGIPTQSGIEAYLARRGYVLRGYGYYENKCWRVWFDRRQNHDR